MDNGFNPVQEKKENVLLGIIGAFLFSLAGAVVWVLLDLVNFIAAISGLVGVFCAIQGYRIFAGKLSKKGIIISVIIAFLVLAAAWYGCIVKDVMKATGCTFAEAFKYSFQVLKITGTTGSYIVSLLMGLGFAVLGSFGTIKMAFNNVKAEKVAQQQRSDPEIAAKFGKPAEQIPDIYAEENAEKPAQSEEQERQSSESHYDRTPGDETKYR